MESSPSQWRGGFGGSDVVREDPEDGGAMSCNINKLINEKKEQSTVFNN